MFVFPLKHCTLDDDLLVYYDYLVLYYKSYHVSVFDIHVGNTLLKIRYIAETFRIYFGTL